MGMEGWASTLVCLWEALSGGIRVPCPGFSPSCASLVVFWFSKADIEVGLAYSQQYVIQEAHLRGLLQHGCCMEHAGAAFSLSLQASQGALLALTDTYPVYHWSQFLTNDFHYQLFNNLINNFFLQGQAQA